MDYGWYIGPALEHYRCYTVYINKIRSERVVVEKVDFFPTEVQLPFQSTRDLATEASKQQTCALANPQPAGPFAQVGDEQLIALKKLAAIFYSALPKNKQRTTTPLIRNTSESPQRVECTVSPHTKLMNDSAPRVVEPTSSNQKNQNSHRRLQTTPHHMTRRSAEPPNLSQDMLDETIQRANLSH
jgi:pyruvate-formate lyase-activating enzyme